MRTIIPGAALAALFVGGCSAGAADRLNTRMEPSPSSVAQPAAVEARLALGREVFDRACAACLVPVVLGLVRPFHGTPM
jgi:cytochrome c5